MTDESAAGLQGAREFFQDEHRVGDEYEDPADEDRVDAGNRNLVEHQIDIVERDVREAIAEVILPKQDQQR